MINIGGEYQSRSIEESRDSTSKSTPRKQRSDGSAATLMIIGVNQWTGIQRHREGGHHPDPQSSSAWVNIKWCSVDKQTLKTISNRGLKAQLIRL